ncbi:MULTISPECIES: hypothetical protein [Paraburkholderia]|uniref:hypothetical protein n=1 Tax=Paraburkholderia TaxID=1822464 RepID=UPI0022534FCF|nr:MULTISPECIES: hypothetical protein [Paraburkholderia]MCX4157751.1 hypothetical protein [Paraburkholderia aspalathi]MDN7167153.1 hypothetical protein [Paraburkholderia sp. SECH2]MDQ6395641.1 hypothetical protein [Paraburkholderia aspalathi]
MATIRFGTLGPSGTNHEYVTRRYIEFHGLEAEVKLFGNFDDALAAFDADEIDYLVQCAVHPDTPRVMGSNFRERFVVDTFISPSQTLAILTRKDVSKPETISLVSPATDEYADLSSYSKLIPAVSIPVAFERLMKGECDSALVYRYYFDSQPEKLRVDATIGSPDDAWIVYGRERVGAGEIVASRESVVAKQFAELQRSQR